MVELEIRALRAMLATVEMVLPVAWEVKLLNGYTRLGCVITFVRSGVVKGRVVAVVQEIIPMEILDPQVLVV